jgi:hypothetical protein
MVLAYSCIAGCTGYRGNYGSTSKPAVPDITPGVSPPPAAPSRIPSTATYTGTHFSFMTLGENAESSGETNQVQK